MSELDGGGRHDFLKNRCKKIILVGDKKKREKPHHISGYLQMNSGLEHLLLFQ